MRLPLRQSAGPRRLMSTMDARRDKLMTDARASVITMKPTADHPQSVPLRIIRSQPVVPSHLIRYLPMCKKQRWADHETERCRNERAQTGSFNDSLRRANERQHTSCRVAVREGQK